MRDYLPYLVVLVAYTAVILWAYWRTEKDDRFK